MQTGRPRTPGIVYASISLALLVLLVSIALTVRQPPPPSIAEFAPQAVEQITDPSEESTAGRAARSGADAASADEALGAQATPSIDVPRVRRCVGDPPRQIEDPQSPPCVPYWSG